MTEPTAPEQLRITKSMIVPGGADAVFDVLVSEDAVAQWMTSEVQIDPAIGGAFLVDTHGWPPVTGKIVDIEAPRLLAVVWRREDWGVALRTTIEVSSTHGETRVTLAEEGFGDDAELQRIRDYLWSHWLVRLRATISQFYGSGAARRSP